jgi:hypothetical protein
MNFNQSDCLLGTIFDFFPEGQGFMIQSPLSRLDHKNIPQRSLRLRGEHPVSQASSKPQVALLNTALGLRLNQFNATGRKRKINQRMFQQPDDDPLQLGEDGPLLKGHMGQGDFNALHSFAGGKCDR